MITHYGLFWSERDVFWGQEGPGGRGELRGRTDPKGKQSGRGRPRRNESEKQRFEDFRNFVGLYCLYSNNLYSNNELLYIGQAGLQTQSTSLFSRLKEHRNDRLAGRWSLFSWFGREACQGQTNVTSSLKQLEAITIAIINLAFNRKSGTFANAKEVDQVPHERSDDGLETKLSRIAEDIELIKRKLLGDQNGK